jgi:hypothetical protein
MDQEREQERRNYAICRAGFVFLSAALVVACLTTLIVLPRHFGGRAFLPWVVHTWAWHWADVPVVWGSLIGSYLLWGRWNDPSWQRRTGLLLVMGMVDAVLWGLDHGDELGLRLGDVGHLWFRMHLGQALGWAEFALMAGIASDVMVHLGVNQASETGRATRSLAATGAVIWMLLFLQQTDWRKWPLDFRRVITLETLLLNIGWNMIWTIALIQVTALSIAAAKQCSVVLGEMSQEDEHQDVFKSRSEADPAFLHEPEEVWAEK